MSTIRVQRTATIQKFLSLIKATIDVSRDDQNSHHVDLDFLLDSIRQYRLQNQASHWNEQTVLDGAKIVHREPGKPKQLSELEMLRLRAEERKYKRLVRCIVPDETSSMKDSYHELSKSLGFAFNMVLGLFLSFLSGYYLSLYSNVTDVSMRVMIGCLTTFGFLLFEVLFIILYDLKYEKKKTFYDKAERTFKSISARKPFTDQHSATISNIPQVLGTVLRQRHREDK